MFALFDDQNIPTNWLVVGLLIVLFLLTFMSVIFAGQAATEGLVSEINPYSHNKLAFGTRLSGLGQETDPAFKSTFLGHPEPPVFYDIGDVGMVRRNRREGYSPDKWSARETLADDDTIAALK